jgi:hypothetical protein
MSDGFLITSRGRRAVSTAYFVDTAKTAIDQGLAKTAEKRFKIKYSSFVEHAALAGNPNPLRVRGAKKHKVLF